MEHHLTNKIGLRSTSWTKLKPRRRRKNKMMREGGERGENAQANGTRTGRSWESGQSKKENLPSRYTVWTRPT